MPEETNDTQPQSSEPTVSEEEMKMPEEQFGATGESEKEPSHLGMILGALIVILVLLLGALYLWGTTFKQEEPTPTPVAERPTAEENNEPETNNADATVQALETVSTSDELSAIEADVESTNLDELDAELNAIEAELDAALQ